jgi:putative ribosome biogenesis GTPase RsgA
MNETLWLVAIIPLVSLVLGFCIRSRCTHIETPCCKIERSVENIKENET